MRRILFPNGESIARPSGEFSFSPLDSAIARMRTVEEIRRANLQALVDQHSGMANLCEKLGYARNETATLTRILNANVRHDRGGKPYNMGSPMAREMEEKLLLEVGWMDNVHSHTQAQGSAPPAPADWPFSISRARLDALTREDWIRLNATVQAVVETREADALKKSDRSAA